MGNMYVALSCRFAEWKIYPNRHERASHDSKAKKTSEMRASRTKSIQLHYRRVNTRWFGHLLTLFPSLRINIHAASIPRAIPWDCGLIEQTVISYEMEKKQGKKFARNLYVFQVWILLMLYHARVCHWIRSVLFARNFCTIEYCFLFL